MEELTKEFIAESHDGLDRMEQCLTTLELCPNDPELVGEIFRAVHSIKGTTGFLGFGRLEALAHAGESLLGKLRDGLLLVDGELITGLLDLLDGLRRIVTLIGETGSEGNRRSDDDGELIATLTGLANRESVGAGNSTVQATQSQFTQPSKISERRGPDTQEVPAILGEVSAEGVSYAAADGAGSNERTLRVDVDVLNRMMNLVGELVLTRNQILQSALDTQGFARLGQRLNAVTADLRETVMQARMQPVGHVFGKFPRLVRDLAKTCGKRVRIEFAGQETGLDKSLLEAIKDPLTHAVRNAVDHGIEMPAVRAQAGKLVEGLLRLRAFHQGGYVVIELSDDGAGISVERVRAKAVERRLVTRERASAMADGDVVQLVFLPGFSTAEAVTNISGRGVGMDVVRANVEKVGGSVELETRPGNGTTLRMRIPLTLAIIPALVVVCAGQTLAVPQSALVELLYFGQEEATQAVERIGGAELYRLRGSLLPLVRLDRLLEIAGIEVGCDSTTDESNGFYLAVVEVDGCRFGLVLDDLLSPEEIVVKPLSLALREVGVFSGATMLGNGSLALILDVAATAARAGVSGVAEGIAKDYTSRQTVKDEERGQRFLLFRGAPTAHEEKRVIPLGQVERIESVESGAIEYLADKPVLRYRGAALPLKDLRGISEMSGEGTTITVLICRRGLERVGLVVAEVFHVATGMLLPSTGSDFGGQVAMLDGRLMMVQELGSSDSEGLSRQCELQEVA